MMMMLMMMISLGLGSFSCAMIIFGSIVVARADTDADADADSLQIGTQDTQANAVRREGIDSALLRYAHMAILNNAAAAASSSPTANSSSGIACDVPLPPSLSGIHAQAWFLPSDALLSHPFSICEFSLPPAASISSGTRSPAASSIWGSDAVSGLHFSAATSSDPDSPADLSDRSTATAAGNDSSASNQSSNPRGGRSPSRHSSAEAPADSVPLGRHRNQHSPSRSVIFVYRSITNFTVYTLPPRYLFLGPILGILSSPPLSFSASINISLPFHPGISPSSSPIFCASFSPSGSISISNLTSFPNACSSLALGDFALIAVAPPPSSSPPPTPPAPILASHRHSLKFIVAAACLSLASITFLVAVALGGFKLLHDLKNTVYMKEWNGMVEQRDLGMFPGASSGISMASGANIRTKPSIEVLNFSIQQKSNRNVV